MDYSSVYVCYYSCLNRLVLHLFLRELSINTWFPDLGVKDKKVRRVNRSTMVPMSDDWPQPTLAFSYLSSLHT